MADRDLRKNAEGYSDPTAYEAMKNLEREDERFHKLLHTIFDICELAGFHLEERIVLRDEQTGKIPILDSKGDNVYSLYTQKSMQKHRNIHGR